MTASGDQYALGRTPKEYERLARQADILRPLTQRLFADAGIGPGATVLDLGSGAGDVAMLAAEIVGPEGRVIGLDLDERALRLACERALTAGFRNIRFVHSDFAQYHPDAPLDAIVGRFVLMYQADPAAALAPLTRHLRPGGVVAIVEPWFQPPQTLPDCTTKTMITCMLETLRRSGAHLDLGPRLHRVFQSAGLPVPHMRFEAVIDGRSDSPLYQYVTDTMQNLLPRALEYGIPGADKLDFASLPGRIAAEMNAAGYAMVAAPSVYAWCRTPV